MIDAIFIFATSEFLVQFMFLVVNSNSVWIFSFKLLLLDCLVKYFLVYRWKIIVLKLWFFSILAIITGIGNIITKICNNIIGVDNVLLMAKVAACEVEGSLESQMV